MVQSEKVSENQFASVGCFNGLRLLHWLFSACAACKLIAVAAKMDNLVSASIHVGQLEQEILFWEGRSMP
jgi:hypothetical protein